MAKKHSREAFYAMGTIPGGGGHFGAGGADGELDSAENQIKKGDR